LLYRLARFNDKSQANKCNEIANHGFVISNCEKAMKQEVAELSGNFCGELSVLETGEGILMLFLCVKK